MHAQQRANVHTSGQVGNRGSHKSVSKAEKTEDLFHGVEILAANFRNPDMERNPCVEAELANDDEICPVEEMRREAMAKLGEVVAEEDVDDDGEVCEGFRAITATYFGRLVRKEKVRRGPIVPRVWR